jgi:dTDP-4-amino-4,6-dideoxygalactose transaminase
MSTRKIKFYPESIPPRSFELFDPNQGQENVAACLQVLTELYPHRNLFLTDSATSALNAIAHTLPIESGDEIICPSFTFVSSVLPFVNRGCVPKWADVHPKTGNVSLDSIVEQTTDRTKFLILVHYEGHHEEAEKIQQYCQSKGIVLIEDGALAFGQSLSNPQNCQLGDFAVISFDKTKHINAIRGGLLLVKEESKARICSTFINLGTNQLDFILNKTPHYEWIGLGLKHTMPDHSVWWLKCQLAHFKDILTKRQKNAIYLMDKLSNMAPHNFYYPLHNRLSPQYQSISIVFGSNQIKKRAEEHLSANGIQAIAHYFPLHLSKFGKQFSSLKPLPHSEALGLNLLRIPIHENLSTGDLDHIVYHLNELSKLPL